MKKYLETEEVMKSICLTLLLLGALVTSNARVVSPRWQAFADNDGHETPMAVGEADYRVVPLPMSIQTDSANVFVLKSGMEIAYDSSQAGMQRNAEFLKQWVEEQTGICLQLMPKERQRVKSSKAAVRLELGLSTNKKAPLTEPQQEAYTLNVQKSGIDIKANSAVGVFRAIQTLRKSMPVGQFARGLRWPFTMDAFASRRSLAEILVFTTGKAVCGCTRTSILYVAAASGCHQRGAVVPTPTERFRKVQAAAVLHEASIRPSGR